MKYYLVRLGIALVLSSIWSLVRSESLESFLGCWLISYLIWVIIESFGKIITGVNED
jgi:hypothetical protein